MMFYIILNDIVFEKLRNTINELNPSFKKQGGITYQGANSFKIAKERSLEKEAWWERVLKERYGEDISSQFKFKNCFLILSILQSIRFLNVN